MNITLLMMALLSNALGSPSYAQFSNHAAAQFSGIMSDHLKIYEQRANTSVSSDPSISVACLNYVFYLWSNEYNKTLKTNKISYPEIKSILDAYGTLWLKSKHELLVEDFYYPGLTEKLDTLFTAAVVKYPAILQTFDPAKIKIDGVDLDNLDGHFSYCVSSQFLKDAASVLKPINLGEMIPDDRTFAFREDITWNANSEGGIEPVLSRGQSRGMQLFDAFIGGHHE